MNGLGRLGKGRALGLGIVVSVFLAVSVAPEAAPAAVPSRAPKGMPGFDNAPRLAINAPAKRAATREKLNRSTYETIPFFEDSFTSGGTTYPYQMVGNAPSRPGTTRVQAVVIPIDLTFQDARIANPELSGSSKAAKVVASPIFQSARWPSTGDITQYADAQRRAEFWNVLKNRSAYHMLLGTQVHQTVRLTVPTADGDVEDTNGDGIPHGYVDEEWWVGQLQGLLRSLRLSPREFPVFVTYDMLAGLDAGYHEAVFFERPNGKLEIFTYAWGSWYDPRWFAGFGLPENFARDVMGLGHEAAEWSNDPFLDNVVPEWRFSIPPVFSNVCSNLLEVGDPLETQELPGPFPIPLNGFTYHLQDLAFLSYFARQSPSEGFGGKYSLFGDFTSYSEPCS
jgi:hypothetical protein